MSKKMGLKEANDLVAALFPIYAEKSIFEVSKLTVKDRLELIRQIRNISAIYYNMGVIDATAKSL